MTKPTIGPLLACAIGDAFGAGFEYVAPAAVRASNDLTQYHPHPKWSKEPGGIQAGSYTDDTQMALAIAEHLLEDGRWNLLDLAERWVATFKRDERTGYSGGFYKLLTEVDNGMDLIQRLRPTSDKNGGAMRAFPIGFLESTEQVRDLAMLQASLTHASWTGMTAAAGAALMFHYCYHCVGPKSDLPYFLDRWLPGAEFDKPWKGKVGSNGIDTVRAALTALVDHDSLGDVLQASIAYTGDVDTVAAISMPAAAICEDMATTLPQVLLDGLEKGTYGRDYLIHLDEMLVEKFPRAGEREAQLEALRAEKRAAKAAKGVEVAPGDPGQDKGGLLDFLFGEGD